MNRTNLKLIALELVDSEGRKVRVTVSGHWQPLQAEVTAAILNKAREMGLGLSDFEEPYLDEALDLGLWRDLDEGRTGEPPDGPFTGGGLA